MKVDMSSEAVTARLRAIDDLCELSWKLMNSKRIGDAVSHNAKGDRQIIEEKREKIGETTEYE